jgi:hypothetical protein
MPCGKGISYRDKTPTGSLRFLKIYDQLISNAVLLLSIKLLYLAKVIKGATER